MQFGLSFIPDDYDEYLGLIKKAERIGIDLFGVPDTQTSLYRECYTSLACVLLSTSQAKAGPLVSNPLTRHPAVTAAAIASANELSGGRAFLAMATGDTGVINLGLRPAKLSYVEEYLRVVRDLMDVGESTWHGSTVRLKWITQPVPIYIAADGPKALRLAGRIADGVFVGLGFLPETVALVEQYIAEGANEVGRSADDIDVWYVARAAVAESSSEAHDLVRASLAAAAVHAFRYSFDGKAVPAELQASFRQLEDEYDVTIHNERGRNANAELVERLGLTSYLVDRLAVAGTEEECIAKFEALRSMGVQNVLCRPMVTDRFDFLDRWERIVAAVRG